MASSSRFNSTTAIPLPPTVRRKDPSFFVQVAFDLRDSYRYSSRQRHITFALQQPLTGKMHSNQRCGTGCLDGETRPTQIEFVGSGSCERTSFIRNLYGEPAC